MKQQTWKEWMHAQAPLHLFLLIILTSLGTLLLPDRWATVIRFFVTHLSLGVLVWGFFRFGREGRRYREELFAHRKQILQMFDRRDAELDHVRATAADLAKETAHIATVLAKETRASFTDVSEKIQAGAAAAEKAYIEANAVNKKIEDLARDIDAVRSRAILVETIKQTGEDTNVRVQKIEGTLEEAHHERVGASAEVAETIKETGEDTNVRVREIEVTLEVPHDTRPKKDPT